ncbi:unnamed protein product [Rhizoctonia solani]|uniref:Uncharacterized protein n=1 Tax=Rhizoctonia solani TaxID=456999 RepID=A0A8H2WV94_9AGAM|nr:unnamed protein product [Rhizoctonia solani]
MSAHRPHNAQDRAAGNRHVLVAPASGTETEDDLCIDRALALAPDRMTIAMIFLVVALRRRHYLRHILIRDFLGVLGNALGLGLRNHQKVLFPANITRAQQDATRGIVVASATKGLVPVHSLARGHVVARPRVRLVQGVHHYGTEEIARCPVAPIPIRSASPMRGRTTNDPNEPLEEGEERSPGQRTGGSRGRARRRSDRKGNWDSFVADEDEEMSDYEGRGSKREHDSRPGRSRSRSVRPRTRSPSKSRSRSPRNAVATITRPSSQEKRSHHPPPSQSQSQSRSHSRSPCSARSPTRSRDRSPARGRSRARSRSRSSLGPSRSCSRSPYRQSHRHRDREPWTERDRKSSTPAPNPSTSSAIINVTVPSIPTGPRLRAGANLQLASAVITRAAPATGRSGAPPTGPRGDREPPRGPRNMVGLNVGAPASVPGMNGGPGWEHPQLAFQSYLAAVQNKLDERQGKRKDEETADDEPNAADTTMNGTRRESDAMDLDAPEERDTGQSYSNTPAPGPSVEGSRVASPAHPNARQSSASLHASPLVGQGIPLPGPSGTGSSHAAQPYQTPQTHPLSLPPRPRSPPRVRSPPRGPRATRGLPEKPKGIGLDPGREGGAERDRGVDATERGRDRNDWGDKNRVSGEPERKAHSFVINSARQARVATLRATTRNSLFPELEKELAALEEQRARLANEHIPLEIALRQAVDELALSTIECRAAEDRRIMTETVLEAMVKGSGLGAGGDV